VIATTIGDDYRFALRLFPVSPLLPILALYLLAGMPRDALAWQDVPLRLDVPSGLVRHDWPLVVNVPFAPGVLGAGQSVALRRGATLVPTQMRPLLTWPDGSIRWLALDSVAAPSAGSKEPWTVVQGQPPPPARPVRMVESATGIAVDTGAIVFEVPRDRFAIAAAVRMRESRQPMIGAVSTSVVADGLVHAAGPPQSLRLTAAGPVRGALEMRGALGPDLEYLVRLEVFAGSPFIRVLHTITKTAGRTETEIERLAIDVPFVSALEGRYAAGVARGKPIRGEVTEGATLSFAQPDNLAYTVDGDRRKGHLAGWFEVSGKKAAVGLASRWFWQEYPKGVSFGPTGIAFDLWSPAGGVARLGMGAAKTHEAVLWLAPRGEIGEARGEFVATPLRAGVPPAHIARSGALRNAIDPDATSFDEGLSRAAKRYAERNARDVWHDCGRAQCDVANAGIARTGAFGMLNWGDWNFPGAGDSVKGTDAWGNLEYDTTQVLALTYAATGDPAVLDAAEAAARHFMDVDTIHAAPSRPEWVGMNHPKNPRHFSFELGGVDLGHTWAEGLLSYYMLTGDERGLIVARGIADYLARRQANTLRGNPRQWGWPQIALVAVFDVTREKRYIDAARGYATAGMKAHPPLRKIDWKQGILADALSYTHEHAGGVEIETWLLAYATKVVAARPRDPRFYPAVAYAGRISGKPEWIEVARRRVARLELGNWGKPFTSQGRLGLRIHSLLQGATKPTPPAITTSPPP
jgi:hypothetical protein